MSLSQIELVWVRVRVEGECFWVNLREENKMSEFHKVEAESKMAEFNMAEIKITTINKLSLNEWVKFSVQMVGKEVWVTFFLCKWWDPILASMSEFERKN